MNDFVAIDVETANREPSSICAIGAVKVRDGINNWLDNHGCSSVSEIIGALEG